MFKKMIITLKIMIKHFVKYTLENGRLLNGLLYVIDLLLYVITYSLCDFCTFVFIFIFIHVNSYKLPLIINVEQRTYYIQSSW